MRSTGNLHPEWGYLAPTRSFMRTVRIALVSTAIGAIGGAGVVVSLFEQAGSSSDNFSAYTLLTRTPVNITPRATLKAATPSQALVPQNPATANAQPLGPATVSTSTPNAIASARESNRTMAQLGTPVLTNTGVSAAIPLTAEMTATLAATKPDVAPETVPEKRSIKKRHLLADSRKRWRHLQHRPLFDEYGGRNICCAWRRNKFGSMHDDW
jgi:hypothetical protein